MDIKETIINIHDKFKNDIKKMNNHEFYNFFLRLTSDVYSEKVEYPEMLIPFLMALWIVAREELKRRLNIGEK